MVGIRSLEQILIILVKPTLMRVTSQLAIAIVSSMHVVVSREIISEWKSMSVMLAMKKHGQLVQDGVTLLRQAHLLYSRQANESRSHLLDQEMLS